MERNNNQGGDFFHVVNGETTSECTMRRKQTRRIQIGNRWIGGGEPILIQSMTNTKTEHVDATVAQIHRLESEGCEIIRVAVPNIEAADAIKDIKQSIGIPLVADIHFDYRLAIRAIEAGADKIRINPGNIGDRDRVRAVVDAAKAHHIPIRVGVNSGSVKQALLQKMGMIPATIASLRQQVEMLESMDYKNIVLAIKSTEISETVEALREAVNLFDYPVHIGITETGTLQSGVIKSSVGLGILLYDGIGDTMRVSLSADPVEEVRCAKKILSSLRIRHFGPTVVACPTCGRTNVDLISLATKVEAALEGMDKNLTVAVMGCEVNGPGEAKNADLGIAGGKGEFLLFRKGEIIGKVKEGEALTALIQMVEDWKK